MPTTGTKPAPAAAEPKRSGRRPALIATAIALPITVLLAIAFTAGRGGSSPKPTGALDVATFTIASAALAPCEKVSEKLPITLDSMAPRVVHGPPFVVAWGNPSVVYKCGVARPANLNPNLSDEIIDVGPKAGRTVQWLPVKQKNATIWTAIDRSAYIQVTTPSSTQGADVITELSGYIASALPAVCQAFPVNPSTTFNAALDKSLCVNRK